MDPAEAAKAEEPKPPYLAFQTFLSFLTELAAKPLPPQIDRSIMNSRSGTDQAGLFAALKFFGLIDSDQLVLGPLKDYVIADEAGRKIVMTTLLSGRYPRQLEVSAQNGTEKMLLDSFEEAFGYTGDTRRKAMTFLLHGARWAGIKLSPNFPTTRMGSGRPATSRTKRTGKRIPTLNAVADRSAATDDVQPESGADTYTIHLSSGGTVTLAVKVSHFALSKNRDDRDFVNGLIDTLTDYGEVEATSEDADREN